jgi:Protein of unknown function (DUF3151)
MSDETEVTLSRGLPETVLPDPPAEWSDALGAGLAMPPEARFAAVAAVAGAHPRYLDAWAELAEMAGASGDEVASYAYARVGYHRGLDTLRGAGWRGNGYVRWRSPSNRGFLRSLDALRRAAENVGETEEAERCELFLYQLDPEWGRVARS